MAVEWTSEQKSAIEARKCNVLTAAAAGSGKTAVLTQRIINILSDDKTTGIDRMLITTFTDTAAKSMKEKISDALEKLLESNPDDEHIMLQITLLNAANICTVHSFCMKIIKQNFHMLGLDPSFRLCDDDEARLIRKKTLDELFESELARGSEDFLNLLQRYATLRSSDKLKEIIIRLYNFYSSVPDGESYFDKWEEAYNKKDYSAWFSAILQNAADELEICRMDAEKYLERVSCYAGLSKYADALSADIQAAKVILSAYNSGDIKRCVTLAREYKKADAIVNKKLEYSQSLLDDVKEFRISFTKTVGKIAYDAYGEDEERQYADLDECAKTCVALMRAAKRFCEMYSDAKKEMNVLDFNDLEQMCVKLLSDKDDNGNVVKSDIAKQLSEEFDYVMVDEYQDTNDIQDRIFELVSNGSNLFAVGDMKQSIYAFRHTNPKNFKRKKDTFSDDADAKDRRIIMSSNFRSRREIIDVINTIFERICSERVGDIVYDETERLNFGAKDYPESDNGDVRTEVIYVSKDGENYGGTYEAEHHLLAQRINELIESGYEVYDSSEKAMRKIKYSDIAVLMRSIKNEGAFVASTLALYGIPAYCESGENFFENTEIMIVMSILKVIDNPYQDIELLALLRGPVFDFSDDELLKLRLEDKNLSIYECLNSAAKREGEFAKKCASVIQLIERFVSYSEMYGIYELIGKIFDETLMCIFALSMRGGEYRRENLNLLLEKAYEFEKTGFRGLFNFLVYADSIRKDGSEDGDAKILGEDSNVVRVMTIHKSKGLEFPVVFLIETGKGFNDRSVKESVLIDQDMGIGCEYINADLRYHYPSAAKKAIKLRILQKEMSEQMRVLYVALTRAREKLIIMASGNKKELSDLHFETDENGAVPVSVCATRNCYIEWIMAALLADFEIDDGVRAVKNDNTDISMVWEGSVKEAEIKYFSESEKNNDEVILPKIDKSIVEKLEFSYPDIAETTMISKISVTEAKRRISPADDEAFMMAEGINLKEPAFILKEDLTKMKKGTIMHIMMQNIPLCEKCSDEAYIKDFSRSMLQKGVFTDKEAECVDCRLISEFFKSDLGRKMLSSGDVKRELPFEINIDASEIYKDYSGDEKILMQGIIDCLFVYENALYLLDYKTDVIYSDIAKTVKQRYGLQIEYYKKAARILYPDLEIKSCIYLFCTGDTVWM